MTDHFGFGTDGVRGMIQFDGNSFSSFTSLSTGLYALFNASSPLSPQRFASSWNFSVRGNSLSKMNRLICHIKGSSIRVTNLTFSQRLFKTSNNLLNSRFLQIADPTAHQTALSMGNAFKYDYEHFDHYEIQL